MSWAIRNALPVPVLGARRRKLPTGRSLRQLTEARLRLRRSQARDPLVAHGTLASPHFTSMRAPKKVKGPRGERQNGRASSRDSVGQDAGNSEVGGDQKKKQTA